LADGSLGEKQTLDVGDPPLCLHAWKLAFDHPVDGRRMEFVDAPPAWA
jgi:23S rRNA-/tRNA-specific pseudouridylate synthase